MNKTAASVAQLSKVHFASCLFTYNSSTISAAREQTKTS